MKLTKLTKLTTLIWHSVPSVPSVPSAQLDGHFFSNVYEPNSHSCMPPSQPAALKVGGFLLSSAHLYPARISLLQLMVAWPLFLSDECHPQSTFQHPFSPKVIHCSGGLVWSSLILHCHSPALAGEVKQVS